MLTTDKQNTDAILLRGMAYFEMGSTCIESARVSLFASADEVETALSMFKEGLRFAPEHTELKRRFMVLAKRCRRSVHLIDCSFAQHLKKRQRREQDSELAVEKGDYKVYLLVSKSHYRYIRAYRLQLNP